MAASSGPVHDWYEEWLAKPTPSYLLSFVSQTFQEAMDDPVTVGYVETSQVELVISRSLLTSL